MPVKRCQKNGKSGHKFGDSGKCFTGKRSQTKAARQGQAVKSSQNRKR